MFENKTVDKEKKNNKFEIGAIYRCVVDSLGTFTKGQDYIAITENELVDDNGSPVSLLSKGHGDVVQQANDFCNHIIPRLLSTQGFLL